MTEQNTLPKLAYGFHRFKPEYDHIIGWGARLIFEEVMDGYGGVVYDRQDVFGEPDVVSNVLFPCVEEYTKEIRKRFSKWDSGSEQIFEWDKIVEYNGKGYWVDIKGSPQKSYGYYYITALAHEV